jgi:hypothetical protein
MKTETPNEKNTACDLKKGDCSCSQGLCPGMVLGGVLLAGWAIYALGTWIWGMIAG